MSSLSYLDLPHAEDARGVVAMPGSKSISNRVLLLAALAQGATEITGLLDSDDTRVMLAALRALGVGVQEHGEGRVTVQGAGRFPVAAADLFLGNAGTAMRPLTAALALMGGDYRMSGVPRMHERPIGDLVGALRELGAEIEYTGQDGYPPLRIGAATLRAGQAARMPGTVSSQFLTALLLAAPIFTATTGQPLVIDIVGDLISKPYIEITLNLMARYGVQVERTGWSRFTVPAQARYISPGRIAVEGDASSASYFLALGAVGGGPVRVTGVGRDSIQGDIAFADTLESMGVRIEAGADWIEASGVHAASGGKLRAFDADFNLIPDAAMTAAALALFADGPCRLRNIGSWRVKETDRIHAMQTELEKLGATVESGPDWLRVTPPTREAWRDAHIGTWDDHRMAMSMSLAAFGPAAVRILDPGCVSKTFPTYFDVYAALVSGVDSAEQSGGQP
ncbi:MULTISPECIES: 3-phosphoshikimate 1-carboxyvinyltransferase [unclassified Achromobacter]|uniref:3-phosphoshikimate 1-carboxyvinyltransferase n=1 Tax=unclassified Achromobacter TaxID=2626865 RepID=UPI000B517D72|nr:MULTISPECIES: 3-phosphoshikimate 1-carboxyvinyltransferase [unclassified Achromobacter]OWT70262.1 3-phosphoshikimate 1-carboxyvinyltransferase [Achromobacter sp. HZ34]OWT71802.1 3-phosphoshikimate 1-carboxyvinyltransferase [Achromobacter sp. HZ28]